MKTHAVALAAHIATRETTLAYALKITRTDGEVVGFTSHDVDDTVSGVTYSANPGLEVTNIEIAANAAVGNLELTTLHDSTVFTTVEVLGGVWRNAAFEIFRYNYASLTDGTDQLLAGTLGEFELRDTQLKVELRDLRQYLQQPVGEASSKTCRYRFGDDRCRKDLTLLTVTGTLTSVTSNQVFRDSSRAEAVNYFDEGELTFDSGANEGISAKVKSYAANGTFTLALPMIGTVGIGDTYTAVAGCRKRLEDCIEHDNVLNFGGEPHRRGMNNVIQRPDPSV